MNSIYIYIYTSPNSILDGSGGRGLRAGACLFLGSPSESAISGRRRREHREMERPAARRAPDRGPPRDRPRPIAGSPAIWVPRTGLTRPDRGTPRDSGRPIAGGPARSGRIGSGSRDSSRRPGADRGEPRSLAAPGRANGSSSQGSSRLAGADPKGSGDLPVSRTGAEAASRTRGWPSAGDGVLRSICTSVTCSKRWSRRGVASTRSTRRPQSGARGVSPAI